MQKVFAGFPQTVQDTAECTGQIEEGADKGKGFYKGSGKFIFEQEKSQKVSGAVKKQG